MPELNSLEIILLFAWLLPLLSFLVNGIMQKHHSQLSRYISPILLFISALLSTYLFFSSSALPVQIDFEWFRLGDVSFPATFEFNALSQGMMFMVTLISFLVHVYSTGYMTGDQNIRRYFAMLGFFTFSMVGIVLSNNLILLFVFWELVGFSSFMLIGHWIDKPTTGQAAQKAFLFNRVGDAGFLIGIMIIWANTQTLDMTNLLQLSEVYSWQTAATLCIFCGVIGKSAQLPLFTWLPDAMEGPTPVSALIHAATMVVAGVFLLIKLFPVFTTVSLNVVAITGVTTALVAAFCAMHQFDMKRILAYSTISQLGLMVTAVGMGSVNAALAHLLTHAFFKAGLFLAIGTIIHALHIQDIRELGGLRKKLPVTFFVCLVAGAALAGVPLTSGFVSKDAILTTGWIWAGDSLSWKWIVLLSLGVTSVFTVCYVVRMIWFIFFGEERQYPEIDKTPLRMQIPIMVLAILSTWLMISINPLKISGWFSDRFGGPEHSNTITLLSGVIVLLVLIVSWAYYRRRSSATSKALFQRAFNIDALFQKLFEQPSLYAASTATSIDKKWIDGFLHITAYTQVTIAHFIAWSDKYIVDGFVNGLAWLSGMVGSITRSFQGGKIQLYIFWAMAGVIIFLFFVLT